MLEFLHKSNMFKYMVGKIKAASQKKDADEITEIAILYANNLGEKSLEIIGNTIDALFAMETIGANEKILELAGHLKKNMLQGNQYQNRHFGYYMPTLRSSYHRIKTEYFPQAYRLGLLEDLRLMSRNEDDFVYDAYFCALFDSLVNLHRGVSGAFQELMEAREECGPNRAIKAQRPKLQLNNFWDWDKDKVLRGMAADRVLIEKIIELFEDEAMLEKACREMQEFTEEQTIKALFAGANEPAPYNLKGILKTIEASGILPEELKPVAAFEAAMDKFSARNPSERQVCVASEKIRKSMPEPVY